MKITLGIPSNRGVKLKTVESLLNLVSFSKEIDFHIVGAGEGYTTAENRNYLAVQALKNGSDYLLFVDDDMIFPADTLDKLLKTGKQIVGVLSYSRKLPLQATVWKPEDIKEALFECEQVGGGVLLIDTKVFNEMERPWFAFETYDSGMIKVGEDAYFCQKAKTRGISVWCEPSISIGHIGNYVYGK